MRIDHALAAAALSLASGALHAYQIIEGRYRVEIAPGVLQDQLVVRCDDGRTLTVPWETKLAEACREGLMGEPLPKAAAKSRPPAAAANTSPVHDGAKPAPAAPVSAQADPAPASLLDPQAQQDAMLTQVRAQFGNVPEQYIEFKPGADGLSMRFLPPLSDILRKYETCRRARDLSADCGGERDRALARLSDAPSPPLAVKPEKPHTVARKHLPTAAESSRSNAPAAALPGPATPAVQAPAPATPDRAVAEQKIGEDYAWCMRAKPKFECEQARARALGEIDRVKGGKAKRPDRQAATLPGKVAAAR